MQTADLNPFAFLLRASYGGTAQVRLPARLARMLSAFSDRGLRVGVILHFLPGVASKICRVTLRNSGVWPFCRAIRAPGYRAARFLKKTEGSSFLHEQPVERRVVRSQSSNMSPNR